MCAVLAVSLLLSFVFVHTCDAFLGLLELLGLFLNTIFALCAQAASGLVSLREGERKVLEKHGT